jgi:hypothetical protein
MSEDYILQANANKILEYMTLLPNKKFTVKDLESRLSLDNESVRAARDYLLKNGYIKEIMSVKFGASIGLGKSDEKSGIFYQVTLRGENYYEQLSRERYQREELERRVSEYDDEQARIKKSNKRWIIGCVVGFVVVMTIAIVVALAL